MDIRYIDQEYTYTNYGYQLVDLSPKSHKPIIAICEFCNNRFETTLKKLNHATHINCITCRWIATSYTNQQLSLDKHEYWIKSTNRSNLCQIDLQSTIDQFGYTNLDINKKINQKIIAICEFCNNRFETTLISFHTDHRQVACQACSSIVGKFNAQSEITNKHEYYLKFKLKLNEKIKYFKINHPGSDKKLTMICNFCHVEFSKQIKNINYVNQEIVCKSCASLAAHFHKQSEFSNPREFYLSRHLDLDFSVIDLQATQEKFGYNVFNLKNYGHHKVVVKCCFCGQLTDAYLYYLVKQNFRKTCLDCRKKKNTETLLKKYGVSTTLEVATLNGKLKNPSTEQIIESLLIQKYQVKYIRNFEILFNDGKSYSFDFLIPSIDLLIECQGDYFHDFKRNGYSGTPKDRAKVTYIETYTSFKLIHIWEHEIHLGRMKKILDYHINNLTESIIEIKSLYELEFKIINSVDAHSFLSSYHYLGNLGTVSVCYGAYFNNQLVCVCTFGGTTRQNTFKKVNEFYQTKFSHIEVKELRRFCIKPNVTAKRMASFCLRKFIQLYKNDNPNVNIIIGFSDPTVCDSGSIYKYAGWTQLANTSKSYHYLDPSTVKMIHKKTVWNCANRSHLKEKEFVSRTGLIKVNELSKYMWSKQLI